MLDLAGLTVTPERVELVKKPFPSIGLKIRSFLYLLLPSNKKKLENALKKCIEQGLPTSMVG